MNQDQRIHRAAARGKLSKVQRMITEDPSLIELRGQLDNTPLLIATQQGHAAMVEWLIGQTMGVQILKQRIYMDEMRSIGAVMKVIER